MNDEDLLRYSRQILLPEIDLDGQEALGNASVLIIGIGGLGSAVSMYLAAAGVGRVVLVDHDKVELSNLQRQLVHATSSLGQLKVESAKQRLVELNPRCHVEAIPHKLEGEPLLECLLHIDVVVDCTDNFAARHMINAACVKAKKPLVSGAAIRFEAQLSVFDSRRDDSPCYACLYPAAEAAGETCSQNGVVAPLLGIIGSMQALEAIKLITSAGTSLCGRLLLFDGATAEWRSLRLRKDPDCTVCGKRSDT